jgi:NADH dehydrogenase/NADH:ubiquinone oxidoreductase subunit G
VGLDDYKNLFDLVSKKSFIVTQTPYADSSLEESDLILPSTSFLEKESTFINLEGRVQKTAISLKSLNLARHDAQILKTIFASHLKKKDTFNKNISVSDFKKNNKSFTKNLFKNKIPKKLFKTSFKAVINNFFITSAITKNSLIMSKCFLVLKQNYSNFI